VPADLAHLASIDPLALRLPVARERLSADPAASAPQLEAVLHAAQQGDARARWSVLACCLALVQAEDEPWVEALAAEAGRQELPAVGALLLEGDAHRAVRLPGRLPDPHMSAWRALMFASMTPLLRARHRRFPVDRALAHPDPQVVARLLRGPALRLGDALAIASRRPTSDAIVREITGSLRWMARTEVREAIVANPFVRPRIALMLLPTLLAPARRALGRGAVHPLVRRAAHA